VRFGKEGKVKVRFYLPLLTYIKNKIGILPY